MTLNTYIWMEKMILDLEDPRNGMMSSGIIYMAGPAPKPAICSFMSDLYLTKTLFDW